MKCPTCQNYVSAKTALSHGAKKIVCASCGATLRVSGLYAFAIAPQLLFLVFPYTLLPDDAGLIMLVMGSAVVLLYWVSFAMFVRLIREDQTGENSKGLTIPINNEKERGQKNPDSSG